MEISNMDISNVHLPVCEVNGIETEGGKFLTSAISKEQPGA
jgi:hypothetical protein